MYSEKTMVGVHERREVIRNLGHNSANSEYAAFS